MDYKETLNLAYDAIQQGAVGVDMGRNIWQSDYPVPMIKAIRHIVREKGSAKEAGDLFNSIKNSESL